MTVTTSVRADALLVRAQRHELGRRFDCISRSRSCCLWPRAQRESGVSAQVPPNPPPPPSHPKGTGSEPESGRPGGHFDGFVIFVVLAYFFAVFPTPPAIALESLPIVTSQPNSEPLKMGGASEGLKDDLDTVRRLLRDVFMEQLSLRKRQDALDQPSQQAHSLVDATAASALRRRWKFMERAHSDAVVTISHNLELQGGYMNSTDDGQNVLSSLHTGPRLHSLIHSQLDSDTYLCARTMASAAGISLWQAQLKHVLWDRVTILMSPVGARFKDIAQSLHASKGTFALTKPCMGNSQFYYIRVLRSLNATLNTTVFSPHEHVHLLCVVRN